MAERSHSTPSLDVGSLEQLVAHWPDAVLVFDGEHQRYIIANDAAVRLVGYQREEILELQPSDLSHPDDARDIPAVVAQAEREGAVRRPWRAVRKDGTVVQTEMTLTRRRIDGRIISHGVFRLMEDGHPTDRDGIVSAEARLKIVERTSLAVVMLDRDGVVTYWNEGANDLYGLPASETIGRQVRDLAQTDEDRASLETLMGQHEHRDEWLSRLTIPRPDGEPFEAMVTGSAIRSDDGELTGFFFVTAPLESAARTSSPRMRRARVQCAACGREVAGTMRRKYCSEKCRQWAYYHRHLDAQRARSRQRHERRRNGDDQLSAEDEPGLT
ncbi:MAG: PAS domain-containing protein [Chloroflexota bacterium]